MREQTTTTTELKTQCRRRFMAVRCDPGRLLDRHGDMVVITNLSPKQAKLVQQVAQILGPYEQAEFLRAVAAIVKQQQVSDDKLRSALNRVLNGFVLQSIADELVG